MGVFAVSINLAALWQAVEQSPDDWDRYLVLADALNEAGARRLERVVRWMVKEGKRPEYADWLCNGKHHYWIWYNRAAFDTDGPDKLPKELFPEHAHGARCLDTIIDAILWLADQLERTGIT